MIQIVRKTLSVLILILAIGEGLFPLCPARIFPENTRSDASARYSGTALLFSVCCGINQSMQGLQDAASPDNRLKGAGNSSNKSPVIEIAFTPKNSNLSLSSVLTTCPPSHSPVNAPLSFFHMLFFLLMARGTRKFSAYLPRQGIAAARLRDIFHKNPHCLIRVNGGFSFDCNFSFSGGCHV